MFTIENEWLKVDIIAKGAELTGIYNKKYQLEYMWNADPLFWAKSSPVLFPIIGTLKDDTYLYEGKSYKLSRHGFAREFTRCASPGTGAGSGLGPGRPGLLGLGGFCGGVCAAGIGALQLERAEGPNSRIAGRILTSPKLGRTTRVNFGG